MPYKDPIKRQEYLKDWKLKNPDKVMVNTLRATQKTRETGWAYHKSEKGRKIDRISQWKKMKIKIDNYDETYEWYMSVKNCDFCDVILEGRGSNKKCLDHDHRSGHIRRILCGKCNNQTPIVERKHTEVLLDLHRYFNSIPQRQ